MGPDTGEIFRGASMLNKMKAEAVSDTTELRHAVGLWLKSLREMRGLSQRELAGKLNLDYYTFISQLENGRGKIPANRYREWALILGVDERVFVKRLLSYYDPFTFDILFAGESKEA